MWILTTVEFAATVAASNARQPEIADLLCEVVVTVQRILLVGRMAKYLAVLVQPYGVCSDGYTWHYRGIFFGVYTTVNVYILQDLQYLYLSKTKSVVHLQCSYVTHACTINMQSSSTK